MLVILVLVIILLGLVLVLREPEVRRRLAAVILRRQGTVRAALGMVQPRDLQRQALALVKEKALLSIKVAHLPTDVTVVLNPDDFDGLGATRDDFGSELVDQISALADSDAGGGIKFVLGARPQLKLAADPLVAIGTVQVKVAWLEGTIAATVLPESDGETMPLGGLRLLIEEEEQRPREVALAGQMTVGRDPDSDIRVVHASVSRQHAVLVVEDPETVMISDLSSQNGVEVEGEGRIKPHTYTQIRAGQIARLSKYVQFKLVSEETEVAPLAEQQDIDA